MNVIGPGWVREVVYDERRWELLRRKRKEALPILESATKIFEGSLLHGSLARGDVKEESDIDVAIPKYVPPYLVEFTLERANIKWYDRFIVQATPRSTPKLYYSLDPLETKTLSLPLGKLSKTEYEFYKFGGSLTLEGLKKDIRVPGVDKRLVLIVPTENGHFEESIIGKEEYVANLLKISPETVKERKEVLLRRSRYGRTGVFLEYHIPEFEPTIKGIERLKMNSKMFKKALER